MDEPTSALSTSEVERLFDGHPRAAPGRCRHRLHLAPDGRDRRGRRPRDRPPQRPDRHQLRPAQAEHRGRWPRRWSAARCRPCSRTPDADAGDELLRVDNLAVKARRPRPGRRDPERHLADRAAPARSSAWPACSAPAAPNSSRRCTAWRPQAAGAAGSSCRARRSARAGPARRWRSASAFVPEDRRTSGLVLFHSILANTVVSSLPSYGRLGVIARPDGTRRVGRMARPAAAEVRRGCRTRSARCPAATSRRSCSAGCC